MTGPKVYPICVIGGGAAGTMSALRAVLNNDECLFFTGTPLNKKRSRALWVKKVENIPGFSVYAKGIEEPNRQTLQWIENSPYGEKFHHKKNIGVDKLKKLPSGNFEIQDSKGETYVAKYVVLCTGVMDVQPEIQGSIASVFDYANAQIIDYCLICDGHHTLRKKTAVLGHTDSAAWVAIMLYERYEITELTILSNGKKIEFGDETSNLIKLYGIKIETSLIKEIKGHQKGNVLEGFLLENSSMVPADICFVALGMIVYNELAKQLGADLDSRGFVKTDDVGQSSIPGLYIAGDLRANSRKQIYTSWDHAVSSVNAINMRLRTEKRQKLLNSGNS
jgi:thioredoxin reductase (NADPH)